MNKVIDKLRAIQQVNRSDLAVVIAPRIEKMPLLIQRFDEPFFPLGKAIINATQNRVAAYVFDLPAYMALGAAGMIALERTIDYVGRDIVTVLDGAFGREAFAVVWDENAFGVDAVTLAVGHTAAGAYIARPDRIAFETVSGTPDTRGTATWWHEQGVFTVGGLRLRVVDEGQVYADRGERFSDALRSRIESLADDRS